MTKKPMELLQGHRIEIIEMILSKVDNQLKLTWRIFGNNVLLKMSFYNVSRLEMNALSAPLEVQGFEILDHSQKGWCADSQYEIRDFEDSRICFFCEFFEWDEG